MMDERILKMMSREGFNEVFETELKNDTEITQKAAFEKINQEYNDCFGVYRYASYNSFDFVRRRAMKR